LLPAFEESFMVRTAIALIALMAGPTMGATVIDGVSVDFERVGEGFERPVVIAPLPGDGRLLVVEKTGTVRFLNNGLPGDVFLDLSGEVSGGNEQGLLGLAFDPGFAENGRLYVNYTDRAGDTQIVSLTAAGGVADAQSAKTLMSIDQPEANHNGGWIGFGPDDLLYIGMGDGGGGGDRHGTIGNGQDNDTLLGKVLRIDPNGGEPYAIPAGNPFANGGGAPEIFAYGLRNPWRNAFDGGLLYIADVGQGMWEEISVIDVADAAGANLGWRTMEGRECFPAGANCVQGGMVMPVHVYSHDEGCSITGGVVYRGLAMPQLRGRYFFADWCTGVIETLRYESEKATALVNTGAKVGSVGNVNAFGTDAEGEMYVLTDDGAVLKMVPAD
jgi:glucose/arabinose dehydrogenase